MVGGLGPGPPGSSPKSGPVTTSLLLRRREGWEVYCDEYVRPSVRSHISETTRLYFINVLHTL